MARQRSHDEGELSKKLTFLGAPTMQFQDASGLAIDSLNTWVAAQMVVMDNKRGRQIEVELLQRPIETYEEYYRNNGWEEHLRQIMSIAKPEALAAFDAQIREYNALPIKRKSEGAAMEYEERCERIIMGGVRTER